MKKIIFTGFLILGTLAVVVQTNAIADTYKTAAASARSPKKSPTPRDLVYYRNIFSPGKNTGC
jgi:hypothetical protein